MVVNNTTKLDKNFVFKSLQKETKKSQTIRFILSTVLLICAISLIIYGHINNDSTYFLTGYIFLAFAILYYAIIFVGLIKMKSNIIKHNEEACTYGLNYEFIFKQESFQVQIISNSGKKNKIKYSYNNVKKIYDYTDKYIFKMEDKHYLYVDKAGFENKKMEEFFIKNLKINKKKIKTIGKNVLK